jgi:hypothetical protein
MNRLYYVATLALIKLSVSGQQLIDRAKQDNLVQITGQLTNVLVKPLPYAHILVLNNYKGTITDKEGKYSFVVQVHDTIMFSTVGYKRKIIIVPDTLKEPFYNPEIRLEVDTFTIGEVVIYPWKSYEEFKEAFLNLKLPDDDMERARRNIALIKTQIILDETPNARENYQYILNQQYRETFNQGMYPTYSIFNAFAWVKFFEALKRGDFKKYSKTSE